MANQIKDIGNGTGYLYIVDRTGTFITAAFANNPQGAYSIRTHALASGVIPVKQAQNDATKLQDEFDPTFGYRYYIQANYTTTASPTSLVNAVEITKELVLRGMEQNLPVIAADILNDQLTIERVANRQIVVVDTEGDAATDNLDYILPSDFVHGDEIVLIGEEAARVITVRDNDNTVAASKNLYLNGNHNFESGTKVSALVLRFWKPTSVSTPQWIEGGRSNIEVPDYGFENQRADGVPVRKPGVEVYALLASQATRELEAGVDKGILEITGTNVTLVASWAIQGVTSPAPIQGDEFIVTVQATGTNLNGNTLTIFGKDIPQALLDDGTFGVLAHWNGTSWVGTLIPSKSESPYEAGAGTSSAMLKGGTNAAAGLSATAEGADNIATGPYSHVAGRDNEVGALGEAADVKGVEGIANHEWASLMGKQGKTRVANQRVHGDAKPAGFGAIQWERSFLRTLTTNATKTKLLVQGGTPGGFPIPVDTTVHFKGRVVAQQYGGAAGTEKNTVVWDFDGLIQNYQGTTELLDESVLFEAKYQNTHGHSGQCTGTGTTGSIFFAATADDWDGAYVGHYVLITSGTAAGEFARIIAYNGTTQLATVEPGMYGAAFSVAPDITSNYTIVKAKLWEGVGIQWVLDVTASDADDQLVLEFTGQASRNIVVWGVIDSAVIQWTE